jgi:PAS domain S-box-containing protein
MSTDRALPGFSRYGYLAPFAVLAAYGLLVLAGWMAGSLALVQPRSYDAPLPANACVCLILAGLLPIALAFGWRRTSLAFGFLLVLLAGATLLQSPADRSPGLDNLLVRHEALVAGTHIGRMSAALAVIFLLTGLNLTWFAARPGENRRPVLLGMLGSLCSAYGLAGLLAYRAGLDALEFWQTYARLGPHTAVALILLGAALILLAARATTPGPNAGPRWLWLPVVACSVTVTVIFWVALRQRELGYINSTTQLTIDNIATLFSGECEAHVDNLSRLAAHWKKSSGRSQAEWEMDAAESMDDFKGYRSIQWVDAGLHTRWFWPHLGNEDAPSYDHAGQPLRRAAVDAARLTQQFAVAAPLESPLQSPSFAVYVPVSGGGLDGFMAGDFHYDKFFDIIDRRLNISRRYQLVVMVANARAVAGADHELRVFEAMTPDESIDVRLRQSANYNLFSQRMTITLTPRPVFLDANRQYLPEVALFSGLGVTVLFGLVINLAQASRRRQLGAEQTARQLRMENEERRRVEARLKTTDERLNLALDSTQVGVYEWDVVTDQVYFTPSIWKMIGYDPAEMPANGQGWLNLLHAEDQTAVRAVIEAHFRGETPFIEIEHCVRHRGGEWLWIALRAKCTAFNAAHQPQRVLGTIQNINARKRADEALRASQAESRKLSLVASKTDNAVIITDHQGRIEWVNESYTRLTGRRLTEVMNRPLTEMLASPDTDPTAVERIRTALGNRESISTDVVQHSTGERRFHVHLDAQPITNDEGLVENFIAIETDITARVETEQQLRRAKTEADATSRAKSEFLATMSHEIRTPMNGVIGMTSLLLETDLTAEQRDYVNTVRTSGDALLSIINEILDFSKIESGKLSLESQPFELTQCVEEAVDIFAQQAAAKNIELAYAIDAAVPRSVLGDITRLRQVLVNLVNNAVKFTERGFITIEVRVAGAKPPVPDEKVLLDFFVTDTGIGIPAERLGQLFKPFSQLDSSTTRKYGGTGLGLAICDRLCQLMGGVIDVTSTPGQGSCFHFSVESTAVNLAGFDAPLFVPIPGGGPVLAVDDHPVNRAMLAHCLNIWQMQPKVAADIPGALQLAGGGPLAAAIIDLNLAGVSGLELVAALRAGRPELPVILLTPAAGEAQRRSETNDPLILRLAKPIKPYALHNTLRHAIVGAGPTGTDVAAISGQAPPLAESIPLDILLVEDNPVNQKVALRFLERIGYRANAVANGLEAVQAVRERDYKLLFMDVQMPEMDGFEATREIRAKIAKERQPVIIALTANAMQGDRERCLEAGMDDYISKPVKIDDIELVIRKFFGPKAVIDTIG